MLTEVFCGLQRTALSVNGTIFCLASDLLGSAEVALNSSGSETASVLYGPYGTTRYTNGAMPADYAFVHMVLPLGRSEFVTLAGQLCRSAIIDGSSPRARQDSSDFYGFFVRPPNSSSVGPPAGAHPAPS